MTLPLLPRASQCAAPLCWQSVQNKSAALIIKLQGINVHLAMAAQFCSMHQIRLRSGHCRAVVMLFEIHSSTLQAHLQERCNLRRVGVFQIGDEMAIRGLALNSWLNICIWCTFASPSSCRVTCCGHSQNLSKQEKGWRHQTS